MFINPRVRSNLRSLGGRLRHYGELYRLGLAAWRRWKLHVPRCLYYLMCTELSVLFYVHWAVFITLCVLNFVIITCTELCCFMCLCYFMCTELSLLFYVHWAVFVILCALSYLYYLTCTELCYFVCTELSLLFYVHWDVLIILCALSCVWYFMCADMSLLIYVHQTVCTTITCTELSNYYLIIIHSPIIIGRVRNQSILRYSSCLQPFGLVNADALLATWCGSRLLD